MNYSEAHGVFIAESYIRKKSL